MRYEKKLIIRLALALALLIIPFNIFQFLLLNPTIYTSSMVLDAAGYENEIVGESIRISNYSLEFIPACVATSAYYLLILLALLTKDISLKKGIKTGLYGAILIFAMNQIRIDLLAIILIKYGTNWFENIHLIFWKAISSAYVAGVWIFLAYKLKIMSIPAYSDIMYLFKHSKLGSLESFIKNKSDKKN